MTIDYEQRYKHLIDKLPSGVHIYRLEGDRLIFSGFNSQASKILGVDNAIFIGKTIEEAFPPLIDTEVPEAYKEACRSGKEWRSEYVNYRDNLVEGIYDVYAYQLEPGWMIALFTEISKYISQAKAIQIIEQRFRLLFEHANDGIVFIKDYIIQDCNLSFAKMLGYEQKQIIGISPGVISPEFQYDGIDSISKANKLINDALQGQPQAFQWNHSHKNGNIIDVEVSLVAFDISGEMWIQAIIRDVTHKNQIIGMLKESEAKFRQIFEISPDAVNICKLDGRYIDINNSFTRITGYSPEEAIGKTSEELDIWVDFEEKAKLTEILMNQGFVTNFQAEFKAKDGHIITALASVNFINIAGETSLVFIARDITEIMNTQREIEKNRKIIELAQDISNIGYFYSEINDGKIIWSDKLYELHGVDKSYDINNSNEFSKLIAPDQFERIMTAVNIARQTGNKQELNYQVRRADGNYRTFQTILTYIDNKDNDVAVVGIVNDITEKKLFEDMMIKRNDELERFEKLVIGRELKMIELKKRIKELETEMKKQI